MKEIGIYSLLISNCVLAELYSGAYNSKKIEEHLKRIEGLHIQNWLKTNV
ncbi:MAG: hypothetical protein JETT_2911 [Candidatus Jettenia ecosi]|uniref:Uncharacterized protein n=1 Tax=Candidatus Jettenia ecosi TaxID=2494326 RepID=A0A533Q839_9BACT|nr:MAG: hypothetical protein JETT_2911 [Candidatus Jettenia ecosi]